MGTTPQDSQAASDIEKRKDGADMFHDEEVEKEAPVIKVVDRFGSRKPHCATQKHPCLR